MECPNPGGSSQRTRHDKIGRSLAQARLAFIKKKPGAVGQKSSSLTRWVFASAPDRTDVGNDWADPCAATGEQTPRTLDYGWNAPCQDGFRTAISNTRLRDLTRLSSWVISVDIFNARFSSLSRSAAHRSRRSRSIGPAIRRSASPPTTQWPDLEFDKEGCHGNVKEHLLNRRFRMKNKALPTFEWVKNDVQITIISARNPQDSAVFRALDWVEFESSAVKVDGRLQMVPIAETIRVFLIV